ncbi:unnamed protein product [Porites evermanni]|uniref:Uncharacterized protein n=1 Tax=Porites evermanni TaxID=104178 RepID=A0ABN8L9D6_9CNID|nr:unnamed protein product [Porites evermanni]
MMDTLSNRTMRNSPVQNSMKKCCAVFTVTSDVTHCVEEKLAVTKAIGVTGVLESSRYNVVARMSTSYLKTQRRTRKQTQPEAAHILFWLVMALHQAYKCKF